MLSSAYVPNAAESGHQDILNALRDLFDKHQVQDRVNFEYETLLYFGQFG